jgi:glucose/arabinose dehydrogenase
MVEDPSGNLLVSIISQGRVVALPDRNHDGIADEIKTVAEGLNSPHGLAFRCGKTCKLYIAETDQIAVYDYDQLNLTASNKKKIIDLPDDGGHFTRTIMFIPTSNQDKLLTSVGSSSNADYEKDWRQAKILISNTDGSDLKTFATQIWATEMGRDYLGDNLPPDEINIIEQDKDYGWPNCYGKNIHDADFDRNTNPCIEPFKTASYIDIPAHSAPLGLSFFPEEGWPEEYWYNLLVAYHGSWNRTVPTGYKIVRYKLDKNGNYLGKEDFITGWLTEKKRAFGRPVDILIQPGVIFISDDKAGLIYKLNLINSSLN